MPVTTRGRASEAVIGAATHASGPQANGGTQPRPTSPGRRPTSPSKAHKSSPRKAQQQQQAAQQQQSPERAASPGRRAGKSRPPAPAADKQWLLAEAEQETEATEGGSCTSHAGPLVNGELAAAHTGAVAGKAAAATAVSSPWDEASNMLLLVVLYMMQGVPLGLTTGAMPFMLQAKLSYTQVGVFSLASYPYSLKLLWSPIVDSCFNARFGRRKSWIVPVQFITAAMLVFCARRIEVLYEAADVASLTWLFLLFVFLAATQDIAVDGWALTLLSPANVGYASTCQTVGVTVGYFTSFTVFLALSNGAFCDAYLRSWAPASWVLGVPGNGAPLVSLVGYLRFWGWAFAAVTLAIALLQPERNYSEEEEAERARQQELRRGGKREGKGAGAAVDGDEEAVGSGGGGAVGLRRRVAATKAAASGGGGGGADGEAALAPLTALQEVASAYRQLWGVVCLPAVWGLSAFLLSYRLGFLSTESAYSLKLIDKGVSKEALAFLVLFQFPIELATAVLAGRWAQNYSPYAPFITGYFLRLVVSAALLVLTAAFPPGASSLAEHAGPFGLLAATTLLLSFASTLTFTALGSFFNVISDPSMGGAYLTLLNTIANCGYLLPRTPMFYLIDSLTVSRCTAADGVTALLHLACPKKAKDMASENACTLQGGTCALVQDGFYLISWVALGLGLVLGVLYLRLLPTLMHLPPARWRVAAPQRA